jgi:predicted dehydrogenase
MMKKVAAILIGAGERGANTYAQYAIDHPHELQFVAVAEPNTEKRERFKRKHGIAENRVFTGWEDILETAQLADVAIICTQDRMHYEPALKALALGYHVLLEKPMAITPQQCLTMNEYAKKYHKIFSICHVLRYTQFFSTIKQLLDEGRIGKPISIQHNENVAYWHHAHSYVRGNWRNSETSSPMILAKSCHDMDILLWLVDADCVRISSFGSLTHFKKENAPAGAPERCLDGCSFDYECPYHAAKIYLTENTGWPASVISVDSSMEARIKALKEGPYGRCVYHCDNNVVDHQVVNIEFANETTATFTMCAFTNDNNRTIKLMGTKAEIRGSMEKNEIEITDFASGSKELIYLNEKNTKNGHGGGDMGLIRDFVRLVQNEGVSEGLTSAQTALQSHLMAFAAEKSRLERRTIDLREYIDSFQ